MTAPEHSCQVTIGGKPLPRDDVVAISLDQRLMRPARLSVELRDALGTGTWVQDVLKDAAVKVGAPVQVDAVSDAGKQRLFTGEVTAIMGQGGPLGRSVTIDAYDALHRLTAGTRTMVWRNSKTSDVIQAVLSKAGLKPRIEATRALHDHLWQHNESDFAFVMRLAAEAGRTVHVDPEGAVLVRKIGRASSGVKGRHSLTGKPGPLEATPEKNVLTWSGRASAAEGVKQVVVQGWERDKRAGTVRQTVAGQMVDNGFAPPPSKATLTEIRADDTVALLRERAQLSTDALLTPHTELQLHMLGSPRVVVGEIISFGKVGKPFDGRYVVTHAVHRFANDGYVTEVECGGLTDRSVLGAFNGRPAAPTTTGPVHAIVTNTNDPERQRRVKLKYPWLDDKLESDWAPVMAQGAGKERGLAILPDVGDEVLVVFVQGDFNHPVVVGGLFNKQDKPPTPGQMGGQPERQTWVSRAGHRVTLVDQRGQEAIEIVNHNKQVTIKVDTRNVVTISTATSDINIKAGGAGNVALEGNNVEIKARANLKAQGMTGAELSSPLITAVKGTTVKLN